MAGTGANNFRLYLNGANLVDGTGIALNDNSSLEIAREYGGRNLNARVDEVRVSSVARSSTWIWATWQNITSNSVFNSAMTVTNLGTNMPQQIATLPASGVTGTAATLNGNLFYTGGANALVTIYWGASDQGTNAAAWDNALSLGSLAAGTFSTNLTGLNAGQFYAYRCFATNSSGASWAAQSQNFTTTVSPPASLAGVPGNGQVLLAWSPSGNGSYLLKRGTTSGGPYAPVNGG
jgi:hypothetical protein